MFRAKSATTNLRTKSCYAQSNAARIKSILIVVRASGGDRSCQTELYSELERAGTLKSVQIEHEQKTIDDICHKRRAADGART